VHALPSSQRGWQRHSRDPLSCAQLKLHSSRRTEPSTIPRTVRCRFRRVVDIHCRRTCRLNWIRQHGQTIIGRYCVRASLRSRHRYRLLPPQSKSSERRSHGVDVKLIGAPAPAARVSCCGNQSRWCSCRGRTRPRHALSTVHHKNGQLEEIVALTTWPVTATEVFNLPSRRTPRHSCRKGVVCPDQSW